MRAIVLTKIAPIETKPLEITDLPTPTPTNSEILVEVSVCGICHTDLDEAEGRLRPSHIPIVLGHQVVGKVADRGTTAIKYRLGERVGITWLYSSCGKCDYCLTGSENLCDQAKWTGKDVNGGYTEYMVVPEDFAHPIPERYSDAQAAPLLCAGVIGYRAVRLCEIKDGQTVGLFGFGASAHIVIQIIRHQFPNSPIFVFTRGASHKELAESLGAVWVGSPNEQPPAKVKKAIDFTPVGESVHNALAILDKAGRLVINAIRKTTPVPKLNYAEHLWHEKEIKSVSNVTRRDATEFLSLAPQIPILPEVAEFEFSQANEALLAMKQAKIRAAAVLRVRQ
jgi:propanol-preferring alcohol dehydrogenase